MSAVLVLRGGQRIRLSEYRPGFLDATNERLDAIAAEADVEPTEVCS